MSEAVELAPYCLNDTRVSVAGIEHSDAGCKVGIPLAFDVP
jgi:hypothetical protein